MSKTSLADFSDRELLELLLTNQLSIFREIRRIQEKMQTGKDKGRGQYWITFKKMMSAHSSILPQITEYLKNQEKWDDSYNSDTQGEG